jgi:hypothetical protein
VVLSVPACGGGNGGSRTRPPATPAPGTQDPCTAATIEQPAEAPLATSPRKRTGLDGDPRGRVYGSLWIHEAARAQTRVLAEATAEDIGDVAVLQDAGDLITQPNRFDLAGIGLRFTPNGSRYDVTRADAAFRSPLGTPVTLQDDDSAAYTLAFGFPFFDQTKTNVFLNSDGNLTFDEEDKASTDRSVSRVLSGPPRVAAFFSDLDPDAAGGRVFVQSAADAFTVTWCGVHGFEKTQAVTVQATLLPDGRVDVRFGSTVDLTDAVVGLSPGHTGRFDAVDLSASPASAATNAAVGERFAAGRDLDLVAVSRRFYASHPDLYDQLVIWTDTRLTDDNTFAFETTVANEIRGLGIDVFDQANAFGSAGRLRSVVMMDTLGKYPSDPQARVLGENSTVSVLGQEVGHRWLAFLKFRDADRRTSDALLGRDLAHWSFFMDSDASVMEGNDIEDLGGGTFRTVGAVSRYSLLDQYAMGLVAPSQVPDFFYVASPVNVQPSRENVDDPQTGVTFSGTRRVVSINDVIDAMGARQPSSGNSPRIHRQAFLYILSPDRTLDGSQVDKVDRIRRAWETFFSRAVDGRARVETRLQPPS